MKPHSFNLASGSTMASPTRSKKFLPERGMDWAT